MNKLQQTKAEFLPECPIWLDPIQGISLSNLEEILIINHPDESEEKIQAPHYLGHENDPETIAHFHYEFPDTSLINNFENEDEMLRIRGMNERLREKNTKLRTENVRVVEALQETHRQLTTAKRVNKNLGQESSETFDASIDFKPRRRPNLRTQLANRLPPNETLIEQSLLGAYLYDPSLMAFHSQPYVQLMFYDLRHATIHQSMIDLGQKLTLPILEVHLKQRNNFDAVGGFNYLDEIKKIGAGSGELSANSLFESLEFLYLQRKLIQTATQAVGELYEGKIQTDEDGSKVDKKIDSMPEYIRVVAGRFLELLPYRFKLYADIKTTLDDIESDFNALVMRDGKPAISTGLPSLDKITHGIVPNRLIATGARPKMGKSTFNINIAYNLALQKFGTAIFTYETSRKEYLERFIARHAMIDSEWFHYFNNLPKGTPEKISSAVEQLKGFPIYIETGKPDIATIVGRATELKMLHPEIRLVIIDGMQAFKGHVPYQGNKSDVYYDILKRLKGDISEKLELTTIINAQLKGDVEKSRGKVPYNADDFSDCKGLSEVVDAALALYRPEEYWPEEEKFRGWMSIIPIALRVGDKRGKTARLGVDMKYSYIYELPQKTE